MNAPELSRHKLNVDDYQQMITAGILTSEHHVELLEGELFNMSPIGPLHSSKTNRLNLLLVQALGDKAIVSVQNPILLGSDSAPQPDLSILRPRADFYETAHPNAEDVLLLIEIADSTVTSDRAYKLPLYARHDIPEVWLLDVNQQQLEIYRQPAQNQYHDRQLANANGHVCLSQLPEVEIALSKLW